MGKPIPVKKLEHPTAEQIDALQEKYISALIGLYDRYKDVYDKVGVVLRQVLLGMVIG